MKNLKAKISERKNPSFKNKERKNETQNTEALRKGEKWLAGVST